MIQETSNYQLNIHQLKRDQIYFLTLKLKYINHLQTKTTAIAQDNQSKQIRLHIPQSRQNIRYDLQIGETYQFICVKQKYDFLTIKNPDNKIDQVYVPQNNQQAKIDRLAYLINNYNAKNCNYFDVMLYVVKINIKQTQEQCYQMEDGQEVYKQKEKYYKLTCFSDGMLINVFLWDWDLQDNQLQGKWVLFSGFKLKRIGTQVYNLVSSVYSKIQFIHQQTIDPQQYQYSPSQYYNNISSRYKKRSIQQLLNCQQNQTLFSLIKAKIKSLQQNIYNGCKYCQKKVSSNDQSHDCFQSLQGQQYATRNRVIKLTIQDENNMALQVSTFDHDLQQKFNKQGELQKDYAFCLKTKYETEQILSHILQRVIIQQKQE